jgi:hypothetical protein
MRVRHLVLAAALALGFGGSALASPAPTSAIGLDKVRSDYMRWGHGHRYGWAPHYRRHRVGYYPRYRARRYAYYYGRPYRYRRVAYYGRPYRYYRPARVARSYYGRPYGYYRRPVSFSVRF